MSDERLGSWSAIEMKPLNCGHLDNVVQPKCPLCGSADTLFEAKIATDEIVELYGKPWQELARSELQGIPWIHVYHCRSCFLCFFEPKVAASPAYYASMQSNEGYYMEEKTEYEMAIKWIPPCARVLEVGCGVGHFAKKLPGCKYTGLEYSESAAEKARSGGLDVHTQSVQEHAATHRAAYDIVCAFQVLEHVPDPGPFIAACLECLTPGGILIYGVPSNDSYLQFFQNTCSNIPPHHLTRWPDKSLEAIAGIFPVSRVAIEHELVSDMHLRDCSNAIIRRRLNALFRRKSSMVDRSITGRVLGRFAAFLSGWMSPLFKDAAFRPRGHTVVAAYRKQLQTDPRSF